MWFVSGQSLSIVDTLARQREVRMRIRKGEHPESVIESLNTMMFTRRDIPLCDIQELSWRDGSNNVRVSYCAESDLREYAANISTERDRCELVSIIALETRREATEFLEPAGLLESTWSYLVGAAMTVLIWALIIQTWDPVMLQQVRGGTIALWLGKPGCTVVALGALVLCSREAWRATHPFPIRHRWQL